MCAGKIITGFVEDQITANTDIGKKSELVTCLVAWSPPKIDWIKLNVDRIDGFALNRGSGSIIEVKLWGIFEGLQIV